MEANKDQDLSRWVDDRLASLNPRTDWRPATGAGWTRLREQSNAAAQHTRRWVLAAGAAFAGSVCLLAFPMTRALAERCVAACAAGASRVGQILWKRASSLGLAVEQRQAAPDFTLMDASGSPVTLSRFRGKVVLLNFWATWCRPCREEIPWFNEFQQRYGKRGLVVLGVSFDEEGWTAVRPFAREMKVNYRLMVGNEELARLYGGIKSLPITLIVDRSGRIAATHTGRVSKMVFQAGIEAVLAERVPEAADRHRGPTSSPR